MIRISSLHVAVEGNEILKGIDLEIAPGEVHAVMGPNGSGKSTLSYTLAGREGYEVTGGDILFNGQSIAAMPPEERARAGLFLGFQYPVEIPGVQMTHFLRTALNARRRAQGEEEIDAIDFLKKIKLLSRELNIPDDILKRSVNEGFSGGEKKRVEILQMRMLEPVFSVLDETDSGLDVDALKIVTRGINAWRGPERAFLLITHYQRLLDHIAPDRVHILAGGRIVASGGPELARQVETEGYAPYASDETQAADDSAKGAGNPQGIDNPQGTDSTEGEAA